ncbi:TIR domain-containing protein [Pseudonocardia sp. NPDC049154]|uniref:TIR domain-containing protein n=1 Tax=Pseudonocardia sp. NPDC049154 TaxID=3155501 RepID=UPI0033D27419
MLSTYDGFFSYAHDEATDEVVAALQGRLERFAKPWWKARGLHIYRDKTAMGAAPALWDTIAEAMAASSWLVVLASPAAAASPWVEREISWWKKEKPDRPPLLVLLDGELVWSAESGSWDTARSTALPPALADTYRAEPFWIDLRGVPSRGEKLDDAVASVAATMRNVPKDRMIGMHVRQQRRTRRHVGIAGTTGAALLAAALIASVLLNQQTRSTTAGLLATASSAALSTDLAAAQLLAVEAYRTEPGPRTAAALFHAVTATSQLSNVHYAGGEVTALAASADGSAVVAGTRSGDVVRWAGGQQETVASPGGPVTGVGISDDGRVISMITAGSASYRVGDENRVVDIPPGTHGRATAVSPSGRVVRFHTGNEYGVEEQRGFLVTAETQSGGVRAEPSNEPWAGMTATGDSEVSMYSTAAHWERHDGGSVVRGFMPSIGNHSQAETLSPGGSWFTFSNGSEEIPVWQTAEGEIPESPTRTAHVPGSRRDSLALAPDGTKLAVSDGGALYIADVGTTPPPASAALRLEGTGRLTQLRFVGPNLLVGAAGDRVLTLDLSRTNRIASHHIGPQYELPWPCNACPPMKAAVRDDGRALVTGGQPFSLIVHAESAGVRPQRLTTPDGELESTDALWLSDGDAQALVVMRRYSLGTEVAAYDRATGAPRLWQPLREDRLGLAPAPDGLVYDVGLDGAVLVREPLTGTVRSSIAAPGGFRADPDALAGPTASLAQDGSHAAFVQNGVLWAEALATGRAAKVAEGVVDATYAGPHLIVRRADGVLEVREAAGHEVLAAYPANGAAAERTRPAGNGSFLAQVTVDDRVLLTDALSGIEVGALDLGPSQDSRMSAVAFGPDGATLFIASPGSNGEIQRLDVSPEGWIRTACAAAGRDLTAEEWATVTHGSAPDDLRCLR